MTKIPLRVHHRLPEGIEEMEILTVGFWREHYDWPCDCKIDGVCGSDEHGYQFACLTCRVVYTQGPGGEDWKERIVHK